MAHRTGRCRGAGRAAALLLPLVAGCAVGPDYQAPEPELPDIWHLELTRGLGGGEGDLRAWWETLDDAVLETLIERATTGSLDLRVALARVMEARAQRGVARGQWFPTLDSGGNYTKGRTTESIAQFNPDGSRDFEAASVGLDASWELDVFGRIRRSTESADASLLATVEDYRDVRVILYADVATSYVEVRSLQQRLRYAVSNAESQRGTLQLTRDRNEAGLAGDLDVRQAELNLARTEASIPFLESQLGQTVHALSVLLGEEPSALYPVLGAEAPIPKVPDEVAVGIPANLMRQRPDVRSAERQLAAQTAQIGVATADLYPRFSLVGSFAFDALEAAKLFTSGSTTGGFGPTVTWNIFDGGRIRNNIRAEDARTEQALARYEQTVLSALQDVEDALVGYTRELERRDRLTESVVAADESVKLVMTLYRTGLTNFQNVLDMERSLFEQQDLLAESEGLVVQNLVRLYRALGGGWDSTAQTMPVEPGPASQP